MSTCDGRTTAAGTRAFLYLLRYDCRQRYVVIPRAAIGNISTRASLPTIMLRGNDAGATSASEPMLVHFIFGLSDDELERRFTFQHYLAVRAAKMHLQPARVPVSYTHLTLPTIHLV